MIVSTVCAALASFQGLAAEIPPGKATVSADLGGTKLELYTYKPASYKGERLILVFHGVLRNADEYRDHSVGMGDRFGALIVAPRFDAERFPSRKYQFGGILNEDRTAAKQEEWTYALIPKIVEAIQKKERKTELKFWLIGHSAGGQFVNRLAAFLDVGAERYVAANPSSWTFPTRELRYGYGFGQLPAELSNDDVLRAYLARPLVVYLGTADSTPDSNTDMSDAALLEGPARHQRGLAFFRFAQTIAERRKWPFRWELVEAEGVGHDHEKMFEHPNCEKALFGKNPLK
jgi:poly(3-hydroxybutyrate) depolymerase